MFCDSRPTRSFGVDFAPLEIGRDPMGTLTEFVATLVVHSSAAAYSHFGVTLEPVKIEPAPAVERTVARTPRQPIKVSDCPSPTPGQTRARSVKA